MALLTLTDVHKAYGAQDVLDGASFFINTGEKVALVGPNGSGKTTMLRMIVGRDRPDRGHASLQPGTRVVLLEQEPLVGDARTVLDAAQRPSPELQQAWAELTRFEAQMDAAQDGDAEAALEAYDHAHHRYQDLGGYECETRAKEVLGGLGFAEAAWEKPVSVLSGGEKTRLALTQVLVLQPDLLLLDEPTNHVDWEACEWLQEYLKRYPGAALIVSHDRFFLDQVVEKVVAVQQGQTRTYTGNYTQYARKWQQEQEQAQEEYERLQEEVKRQEAVVQRFRSQRNFSGMHSREKVVEKLRAATTDRPQRAPSGIRVNAKQAVQSGRVVLEARDLAFGYGERMLFRGVTFDMERGERLGIIGPNGAGKTTLLKVLAGRMPSQRGNVFLGHQAQLAYFAQDHSGMDPEATVWDTLWESADLTFTECYQRLHQMHFMGDAVWKPVSALSGGEKTRLALAMMLAQQPNVLLLDEPTNHLDIMSREAVEAALKNFPGAVIVVSHDRYFLDAVTTRMLEIRNGQHRLIDGGYGRYRHLIAPPPPPAVSKKAAAAPPPRPPQPRKEAQKQQRSLERKIETAETRMRELADLLANPDTYRSPEAADISREYAEITAEVERLYEEWSAIAG